MKYILDMHTHTNACNHAYNTIAEMATSAKEKNLEILGITEHSPLMPGSPNEAYFRNLKNIDRNAYALPLLLGAELNILDDTGRVDLPNEVLKELDIVVASIHGNLYSDLGLEANTNAYTNAMKNPYIHIIGHPDDGCIPIDYDILATTANETHTLLELNNNSLAPTGYRRDAHKNCIRLLEACKKHGTYIIINSDAHVIENVGRHDYAESLVKELGFPKELIVNQNLSLLQSFLQIKSNSI